MEWNIDGWQRLTAIFGLIGDGRTHALVPIRSGVRYQAKLVVKNGNVRTFLETELCNDVRCKPVVYKDIYCSAVRDEADDVILKLVNWKEEQKIRICFDDTSDYHGIVSCMSGFSLSERNSMEEPERVVPGEFSVEMRNGQMEWLMPGQSVVVMCFNKATV